ncbi:MAG TPA: hypothetical protein PLJ34_05380 [Hyphomicrobiales bacterium]|nr:hypothetical protein [Hyphomicrobiales bacterium]
MNGKIKNAPFLDHEEQELLEGIEAALDTGEIAPRSVEELAAVRDLWQDRVRQSNARKAITLRLQERDIERLKAIARRRGLPYQTLVASVLHQFANGDLVERQ